MESVYHIATKGELARLWEKNVAHHPEDERWKRWAEEYTGYNENGMAVTFAVVLDGEPVGEGTLLLSPECRAVSGFPVLVDEVTGNVNALRIEKKWEGQGHISRLMQVLEEYARGLGLQALTIGVDAVESRNLGIYLHWGYDEFVMSEVDEGELVLYYRKKL